MNIKKYIAYKNITFCCQDCGIRISYNSALRGKSKCASCSHKGKKFSEEHCKKLSKAHKGNKNHLGYKHSKEIRLKISKSLIGKNKGKIRSKEVRKNLSKILTGIKRSKETKLKISKANKGKKLSIETRLKISKALIGKNKGKNGSNWQGGISFLTYPQFFSKDLKLKIRCRDNHICQNCGIKEEEHVKKYSQILSIHHIDYNKQNCKEDNLITICTSCNVSANYNRDYWFAYYTYIIEHFKELVSTFSTLR